MTHKARVLGFSVVTLIIGLWIIILGAVQLPRVAIFISGLVIILFASLQLIATFQLPMDPSTLVTVIRSRTFLKFEAGGKVAHYSKRQILIPNTDRLISIVEAGLHAESGRFEVTKFFPPASCSSKVLHPDSPSDTLEIIFDMPPPKGEKLERTLEGTFYDTFPAETEWFEVNISRRIKDIALTIDAPPDRPFLKVWAVEYDQLVSAKRKLPDDAVVLLPVKDKPGFKSIQFAMKNPKIGNKYRIHWDW